jgi:hypothetical protein
MTLSALIAANTAERQFIRTCNKQIPIIGKIGKDKGDSNLPGLTNIRNVSI